MTPRERGFLLLTSHLGDPERRILTTAQLRILETRMRSQDRPAEDRELIPGDLTALGFNREMAGRICQLLSQDDLLDHYLRRGKKQGCVPVTRLTPGYPELLRRRLGVDSPGCLWAKGDLSILNHPAVSLVGSRELEKPNRAFAETVGFWAAENGVTLVSGNARGADRTAQEACLHAGGRVVSILADALWEKPPRRNLLYLSEDGYDEPFSTRRALSRNRCIHSLGALTFVAQCGVGKGGTWDGTTRNLRLGWSPVACFRDGSEASRLLEQMGAFLISGEELRDFSGFPEDELTFF